MVPLHRHKVVDRNRLKRRLREIARLELLPRLDALGIQADVLLRARRESYDTEFSQLRNELTEWLERRWPPGPHSG